MKKLKVAFLWHQHQPYYRIDNEFILPWVLLHASKDYYDIPEVLYEFPNIKQTFNFAPSLNLQIDEYLNGEARDKVVSLTAVSPKDLSDEEKSEIIRLFFLANFKNMIQPYPRYLELYDKAHSPDFDISRFEDRDWLDLQVWYNLTWFGYYSAKREVAGRLFIKGKDFNENEKKSLQDEQFEILRKINYQYRKLKELEQIELSCSPMYHPILPLLIDSAAAKESRPDQKLPEPKFTYPQDAERQIREGIETFNKVFSHYPRGMWPSEGSVSDDVLKMLIDNGIDWIATDEQILFNSLKNKQVLGTEKFFPITFSYNESKINVLFRDHFLSDRIGFVYSDWNPKDAANDFLYHLRSIRNAIIKNHGEDALDYACVSVILDGENCWEYYKDNGIPFLRDLFSGLDNSDEIRTVHCSEAVEEGASYLPELNHIHAGSWINANFDIWIGHKEDISAWNMLSKARADLESNRHNMGESNYTNAINSLMIAEGSDWFWWYGPEHQTKNKSDFDRLFRHHIQSAYKFMGINPPNDVYLPIDEQIISSQNKAPDSKISGFNLYDIFSDDKMSGRFNLNTDSSSMHRVGDLLDSLLYGNDDDFLSLKIKFLSRKPDLFELRLFFDDIGIDIFVNNNSCKSDLKNFVFAGFDDSLIIMIPMEFTNDIKKLRLRIETLYNSNLKKYPAENALILSLIK